MQTSTGLTIHCWLVNWAMNHFVAQIPIRSITTTIGFVSMEVFSLVPTSITIPVSNTHS